MTLVDTVNRIPTRIFVIGLVIIGIGERALFNLLRPFVGNAGEAFNVAAALAKGIGLSDAYRVGQGPTAHVLPIPPAIAGAVYAIFGIKSWPAEFILACWSIALAMGTYVLLFNAFANLQSSRWTRLVALAFACVAPTYVGQEASDFRVWDGGLAVFLCALFLDRLLALQADHNLSMPSVAGMAALAALLFFVNPQLGLGAYACAAITCIQKMNGPQLAGSVGLAAGALAVLLAPWIIRNDIAMGEPILLRSNLGLELAMANYPGALEARDPLDQLRRRYSEIHPFVSYSAFQAMQKSGGEVQYSRQLGEKTSRWMAANPWPTFQLAFVHLREVFMPEAWQFRVSGSGIIAGFRALLSSLVGLLGLLGLVYALYNHRPYWIYPTFLVLIPALTFCMFQPLPRYTYLFYPMLVFCAADLFGSIAHKVALLRSRPALKGKSISHPTGTGHR